MNASMSTCSKIEPLIFASIEAELSQHERVAVTAHLSTCDRCQQTLSEERRLTQLLRENQADLAPLPSPEPKPESKRTSRSKILASLIAGAAAVFIGVPLLLFTFEAPNSYGALRFDSLDDPSTASNRIAWKGGETQKLERSNHLKVPPGARATLKLRGTGELKVIGPAVFEIDRSDVGWKLTLLDGEIAATLSAHGKLQAATRHGIQYLSGGDHHIRSDVDEEMTSTEQRDDLKRYHQLWSHGMRAFESRSKNRPTWLEAARKLESALRLPVTTKQRRQNTLYYLVCSLTNAKQWQRAAEYCDQWLVESSRTHKSYAHVKAIRTRLHIALGEIEHATAVVAELNQEFPNSPWTQSARLNLRRHKKAHPPARQGTLSTPPQQRRTQPTLPTLQAQQAQPRDGYLVVATSLNPSEPEHASFIKTAKAIAEFHRGSVFTWDSSNPKALFDQAKHLGPKYVLFVAPPETLDINLQRRVLNIASSLDDDLPTDFAYGWFTASSAHQLHALWERTKVFHSRGVRSRTWTSASVISGKNAKSRIFTQQWPTSYPTAAGFSRKTIHLAHSGEDPEVLDFAKQAVHEFEDAGVISISGNGDPQGIWLFSGMRNLDRDAHWSYSIDKVGHDPKNEMPRLRAGDFRGLKLDGAVLWSGSCHFGATHRVFVEPDIVSTFGKSDRIEVYPMPRTESLALALIDAGCVALMVPIASNHGISASREAAFSLRLGASLGEAVKSSYDDAIIQAGRPLILPEFVGGKPARRAQENIMRLGAAHRILIGDPALRPFSATQAKKEVVSIERKDGAITARISLLPTFHEFGWNMYGGSKANQWRVNTRIQLQPSDAAQFTLKAVVVDKHGDEIPTESRCTHEEWHGNRFLHVQASGPRDRMAYKTLNATFTLTPTR